MGQLQDGKEEKVNASDNRRYPPKKLFPGNRTGNGSRAKVYKKENLIGLFQKYYIPITYVCLTHSLISVSVHLSMYFN